MNHQLSARKVGKADWRLPAPQPLASRASRSDRRAGAFFMVAVAGVLVLACILALESELALAGTLVAAGGLWWWGLRAGIIAEAGAPGWSLPGPRRFS